MLSEQTINHEALSELVARLRLSSGASELHGGLCGYLAGGGALGQQSLLQVLQLDEQELTPSTADQHMLTELMKQAEHALADSELGFEPLLPADDDVLSERAEALVDWCRGFLGGFGLAGVAPHAQLSAEAREVLQDFSTIAASAFTFDQAQEDEDALIEVQEFVRIGVLLLFTECNDSRQFDPTGSARVH